MAESSVSCHPGEVIQLHKGGGYTIKSVFEVATDRAAVGEKVFAVFECLRDSAIARYRESAIELARSRNKTATY